MWGEMRSSRWVIFGVSCEVDLMVVVVTSGASDGNCSSGGDNKREVGCQSVVSWM